MFKLLNTAALILFSAALGCANTIHLAPAPDIMSFNLSAAYTSGALSIDGLADSFIAMLRQRAAVAAVQHGVDFGGD